MKKNLTQKQVNLIAWIKQNWKTKSGKKSSITGERYLPEKAIKALSKLDYKITTKAKQRISKIGKQFSKQPKYIVEQVRKAYAYTSKMMTLNMMSIDAHEGISAFLQKRKPKWKNK